MGSDEDTNRDGQHEVIVVGGGPTGMMVAAELALAGVDVAIVERRATQELDGSRAGGLHARTIEVLDQRGVAERFLDEGEVMQVAGFALIPLDISDFPTRHPYGLALWQREFERILAGWVAELGVPTLRRREVVGVAQDATGVDVELDGGEVLRSAWVVGCDGGRSVVRGAVGIDFPGLDASTSWIVAEVEMDGEPAFGVRRDSIGTHAMNRRAAHEPIRLVLTEPDLSGRGEPSLEELQAQLVGVYGSDFGLRRASWISRFTDVARQAAAYRHGRVLLAGDAAHVHPPHGGQGMNTGVQDAVNLGWKLARVVRQPSAEGLLDTYHDERHPVGARAIHNTMAQVALAGADDRHQALRDIMGDLLALDGPRRHLAGMLSGLDIRYATHDDLGGGHPLVGWRMPDLDLTTADGPTRVAALLRDARPVLLDLSGRASPVAGPWRSAARLVTATEPTETWALPVVGEIPSAAAVLVRPDGHVAWAGDPADPVLVEVVSRWFGDAPA